MHRRAYNETVKTKSVSIVHTRRGRRPDAGRDELRARIAAASRSLFLERGYRRTTSDEIAAELGISKATLYRAFRRKEDILRSLVRESMADIQAGVESLMGDRTLGFVERMVALLTFLTEKMSSLGPILARDIQRAVPGLWTEVSEFRQERIRRYFGAILEDGRRGGFFRADVDPDLLLEMFLSLIQRLITPEEIRRTGRSPKSIFEAVIKVFFQGLLTDRGRLDLQSRTPALFGPAKEGAR